MRVPQGSAGMPRARRLDLVRDSFLSPRSPLTIGRTRGTAKPQARFLLRGRNMSSPVQASHSLRAFLAVVIAVAVLRYAQDVFLPLALAILLTFLLAPLVDRLQRWRINRVVAVVASVA